MARPGAQDGRGVDFGGICGQWDADRKGGGGGCDLSGILPTDRMARGEGEYIKDLCYLVLNAILHSFLHWCAAVVSPIFHQM